MTVAKWHDLGNGITCIDAQYVEPGIACFYLLERAGEFAVIETGTSRSLHLLLQCLADKGIPDQQLRYVIPTHVHLDHAGGAGTLMAHFQNAQLLVHPRGARHLIDPQKLIASSVNVYGEQAFREMYGEITPVAENRVTSLEDGAVVSLGDSQLLIRHTRGHADHHFCLWDEQTRGWFSGDMFGASYLSLRFERGNFVLPTTTPTQFDPVRFIESVELLVAAQPQRIYLTHYGELPYDDKVKELLCQQVEAYGCLALQHAGDNQGLILALEQCTWEFLAPLQPPVDAETFRNLTAADTRLNAQGLEVWAQRQAVA